MALTKRLVVGVALLLASLVVSPQTDAQCAEAPALQNWTGSGNTVCPCFIPGEEAGAVLDLPPEDFPIEILRVRVGWGSQFGGSPQAQEQAIHIYGAGLPDPGAPLFSLVGPVLNDGAINEFDLEPLPGQIIVDSGPFAVTLEFFNQNAGDAFQPSVVHDGNGCQSGKNVVKAIPGGWIDACVAGLTGDWVVSVVYRPVSCGSTGAGSVPDGAGVPGTPLRLDKFADNLLLSWSGSCTTTDDDYEIYEGTLGSYYSHYSKLCSTGGATAAVVVPAAGGTYYLIVPANDQNEGSYGRRSGGAERPQGSPACLSRQFTACP